MGSLNLKTILPLTSDNAHSQLSIKIVKPINLVGISNFKRMLEFGPRSLHI